MAREIPEFVRAAAGLAATVLDEAQKLPRTLPGLPVRALGVAMQVSMKLQQQYACLVARGDELFTGMRGEDEPGLATFDDDEEPGAATTVNTSAFDRVAETIIDVTDDDEARTRTDEVLDELAIEDLVDATPSADVAEPAVAEPTVDEPTVEEVDRDRDADGVPEQEVLAESPAGGGGATVDVLAPDGGVATVEATLTEEGVAAAEGGIADQGGAAVDGAAADQEVAAPEGDGGAPAPAAERRVENSLEAPATAPVEGYDDWSIAQLRGRLRGYAASTVQQLLDYEQATQAREPYLRMLRNRLERLQSEAS
jgi:hypothetical protein